MQILQFPSVSWLAGAALAVLLTGCSTLPSPPASAVRYDLGPAPAVSTSPAAAHPIALTPMQAPLLTDGSTGLRYRLAYVNGQVLHTYAQARWSAPPAQIVGQRLREHLGQGNRVVLSAVPGDVPPTVQGRHVPVLQLSLEEFSQVFASAQDSSGWVRVRATLIDPSPQGNVLLAQQVFEVRQPAASANAAGGVQALSAGVDQVGLQLGAWLQTVLVAPR